jgi:predicted nucleic acid-binding Zn ribbon protein
LASEPPFVVQFSVGSAASSSVEKAGAVVIPPLLATAAPGREVTDTDRECEDHREDHRDECDHGAADDRQRRRAFALLSYLAQVLGLVLGRADRMTQAAFLFRVALPHTARIAGDRPRFFTGGVQLDSRLAGIQCYLLAGMRREIVERQRPPR